MPFSRFDSGGRRKGELPPPRSNPNVALIVALPAIFRAHFIHKSLNFTGLMRERLDLELFPKRLDLRYTVEAY